MSTIELDHPYPLNHYRLSLVNNQTLNLFYCEQNLNHVHDLTDHGGIEIKVNAGTVVFSDPQPPSGNPITIPVYNGHGACFLNETNTSLILVGTDDLRYECFGTTSQQAYKPVHWLDCSTPVYIQRANNSNGHSVLQIYSALSNRRLFKKFL